MLSGAAGGTNSSSSAQQQQRRRRRRRRRRVTPARRAQCVQLPPPPPETEKLCSQSASRRRRRFVFQSTAEPLCFFSLFILLFSLSLSPIILSHSCMRLYSSSSHQQRRSCVPQLWSYTAKRGSECEEKKEILDIVSKGTTHTKRRLRAESVRGGSFR